MDACDDLRLREAEAWFDPAGFFLAERDGQLAGFHWTKVHPDGGEHGAPIGEVYVVGVDPGQQGGGLGRALTLAGLAHLRDRGLGRASCSTWTRTTSAAVRMYTALGFTRWSADAMYRNLRARNRLATERIPRRRLARSSRADPRSPRQ